MVSGLSISFMAISAIISIGLPVGLFLFWRKKFDLKVVPMLVGAAAFILFALVLEQMLHSIVLRPEADGTIELAKTNPWMFAIYGCLAAGIFEETARLLSFLLLKKKYDGLGTGLSYGIGHGGIEAIAIAGLAMISNIIFSIALNTGNAELLGDVNDPTVMASINTLAHTDSVMFLMSGVERICAITLHISLSMLVWCAVKVKGMQWLYPAAILLHAAFNVPASMYQAGLIDNIYLTEGLLLISAALVGYVAYRVCNVLKLNPNSDQVNQGTQV